VDKTKIEWCDSTWNPVTGCLHGCEYCYARGIARRFGKETIRYGVPEKPYIINRGGIFELTEPLKNPYPFGFTPTFHRYRLNEPLKWKTPRNIFVGSMCDMFGEWVPDEWIQETFDVCRAAPQHRYLFLTKNPKRYNALVDKGILGYDGYDEPNPYFRFGATATDGTAFAEAAASKVVDFMSCEPMLNPIEISDCGNVKWLIIGAETGGRSGKVTPKREWIDDIVTACGNANVAVFMKDSLIPIVGEENMRRELPWKD
jgi:protein gp37